MECAAILDVLLCTEIATIEETDPGKKILLRIVSMLVKMSEPDSRYVREFPEAYGKSCEDEYEKENENDGYRGSDDSR